MFGRLDLFAKRCRKLAELFTTVHQFSALQQARASWGVAGFVGALCLYY